MSEDEGEREVLCMNSMYMCFRCMYIHVHVCSLTLYNNSRTATQTTHAHVP